MELPGGEGMLLAAMYTLVGVLFVLSCLRGVWFDIHADATSRQGGHWISAGELRDDELRGVLSLLADTPGGCDDKALALLSAVDECCLLHDGNLLIGVALLRWQSKDDLQTCELELCEVTVAACVRRVGHGTLLLAFCLERARSLYIPLYVTLEGARTELCPWFERVGFVRSYSQDGAVAAGRDEGDGMMLVWEPDLDAESDVDSTDVAVGGSPRAKQE